MKEAANAAAQRPSPGSSLFNHAMVEDALRALIESIRHRSGLLNIYNKSAPSNTGEPDIRYDYSYVSRVKIITASSFRELITRIKVAVLLRKQYNSSKLHFTPNIKG